MSVAVQPDVAALRRRATRCAATAIADVLCDHALAASDVAVQESDQAVTFCSGNLTVSVCDATHAWADFRVLITVAEQTAWRAYATIGSAVVYEHGQIGQLSERDVRTITASSDVLVTVMTLLSEAYLLCVQTGSMARIP